MTLTANTSQFAHKACEQQHLNNFQFDDIGIKHWSIQKGNKIEYRKQDSHTLSLYINGGFSNNRIDTKQKNNHSDCICFMPQNQSSYWEINNPTEFVHLYFSDELLKQYAAATFGMDVRFVELAELNFQQDSRLKQLIVQSYLTSKNLSPLHSEESFQEVFHYLLKHYNNSKVKSQRVIGGLAPCDAKTVRDYICENLQTKISISQLAKLVHLSPFHFSRMFKLTFGVSPASYIIRVRIDRVKMLLKKDLQLSQISEITGFNQQSHMTDQFRKYVGMTPANYRKLIN